MRPPHSIPLTLTLTLVTTTLVIAQSSVPDSGAIEVTGSNIIPLIPGAGSSTGPAVAAGSSGVVGSESCLTRFGDRLPAEGDSVGFLSSPIVSTLQPCLTDFGSDQCSAECKQSITTLNTETGCCFNPLIDAFLNRVPSLYSSFVPERATILSFVSGPCGITIEPACAGEPVTNTTSPSSGVPAITDLLNLFGLDAPSLNIDWFRALPLNLLSFQQLSQRILRPYSNIDTSNWSNECQAAVIAWRNTTNICVSSFDNAVAALQRPVNNNTMGNGTAMMNMAAPLLLNGQALDTSTDWSKVCSTNTEPCAATLNTDYNNVVAACGTAVSSLDTSIPLTYWNILCLQDMNNDYCYPKVQKKIDVLKDQLTDIKYEQVIDLCDSCALKVIAGYSHVPNEFDITGALPLVCATFADEVCIPFLHDQSSSSNGTVPPVDNGSTGASNPPIDCAQFDSQLPVVGDEAGFLTTPIVQTMQPCLTDFNGNTCSDGCKSSITPLVEQTGCCLNGLLDTFLARVPASYSPFIPKKEQITTFLSGPCGLIVKPACEVAANASAPVAPVTAVSTPSAPADSTSNVNDKGEIVSKTYCSACLNRLVHRVQAYAPLLIDEVNDNSNSNVNDQSIKDANLPDWLQLDTLQYRVDTCITLPSTGVSGQCVDYYLAYIPSTNTFNDFTSWLGDINLQQWIPCYDAYRNNSCTLGCANILRTIMANYTCCVPLMIDTLYQRIPNMYQEQLPNREQLLSFITSDCGVALEPACGDVIENPVIPEENPRQASRVELWLTNVKFEWYRDNKDTVNNNVRRDLMGASGLAAQRIICTDGVDAATVSGENIDTVTGIGIGIGIGIGTGTGVNTTAIPPSAATGEVNSTGVVVAASSTGTAAGDVILGVRLVCYLRTGNLADAQVLSSHLSWWLGNMSVPFPNLALLPVEARGNVQLPQVVDMRSNAIPQVIPNEIEIPEDTVTASTGTTALESTAAGTGIETVVPIDTTSSASNGVETGVAATGTIDSTAASAPGRQATSNSETNSAIGAKLNELLSMIAVILSIAAMVV